MVTNPTLARLALAVSMSEGIPAQRSLEIVRAVASAIREDLETAERFVLPGALVIRRVRPADAPKAYRCSVVIRSRKRAAERIARFRRARAG